MQLFNISTANAFVKKWIEVYPTQIIWTKNRKRKLGDYRFLPQQKIHKITVNGDLDEYVKFFVLTHEIAHLHVRETVKKYTSPHGKEWKTIFSNLIMESIHVYPENYKLILYEHAKNPKANLFTDPDLYNLFFPFAEDGLVRLADLSFQAEFIFNKNKFILKEKRRKRYLCHNVINSRLYLIHANALVKKVENNESQ